MRENFLNQSLETLARFVAGQRGDMRLYLGKFQDAKTDYEKMIQLDPELEVFSLASGNRLFFIGRGVR